MNPPALEQAMQTAVEHHRAGRLAEAETMYRRVLAEKPSHGEALHLLGILALQAGRPEMAVQLIGRSSAINPGDPAATSNFGKALHATGRIEEAIAAHRRALWLEPHEAAFHGDLGDALQAHGQIDEAVAAYRAVLRLDPNSAEAEYKCGNALRYQGRLGEAIDCYRRALRLEPNHARACSNLGNALQAAGRIDESIAACREALRLEPAFAEAHNNLGNALQAGGCIKEAIAAFEDALRSAPDYAPACNNLGNCLKAEGRIDEAVSAYRGALRLKPDASVVYNNLGNVYKDQGNLELALSCYREAIALTPTAPEMHSNLIYTLHFHPGADAGGILAESREWARRHGPARGCNARRHGNDPAPNRRLRIGYVSPDFRNHVVGNNLLPLLTEHDREAFEIFCYSNVLTPDAVTGQIRSCADAWRGIATVADDQAAEMIRADGIDILIDLTMHMAGNRLPIFARKPAPVQASYLASCNTTGLDEIDYRISDPYIEPDDSDLTRYTETVIRLPHSAWCYQPSGQMPKVSPLPALTSGVFTFACKNNPAKVSREVLSLWMEILEATPHSRLMLSAPEGSCRQAILEFSASRGISEDRLEFFWREPWERFLQGYSRVDAALDPFPYNGWITTCDALAMGVPVVSLSGRSPLARGGRSILSNIGLSELIAESPEQYIEIAVSLASDLPGLAALRSGLRERMESSPLRDAKGHARDIEAAYREMWRKWCRERTSV